MGRRKAASRQSRAKTSGQVKAEAEAPTRKARGCKTRGEGALSPFAFLCAAASANHVERLLFPLRRLRIHLALLLLLHRCRHQPLPAALVASTPAAAVLLLGDGDR